MRRVGVGVLLVVPAGIMTPSGHGRGQGQETLLPFAILHTSYFPRHQRYSSSSSSGRERESLSSAYASLGLSGDATLDEVKGAYRRLALRCHPDLNKDGGQEFVRITAAYDRIMNKSSNHYSTSASSASRSSPYARGGPSVYATASSSRRFTPRAAAVWGFGLAMGCVFFGSVLLWARTEIMHSSYQRRPSSRVVEPSSNSLKRERIAALLLERQRAKDSDEER